MSLEQKQKALEFANTSKKKIVTLWKSGNKGKIMIITGALFAIGAVGHSCGGSKSSGISHVDNAKETEQKKADPLGVDKSYFKNASYDTAKANNEFVPVKRGTSIMTLAVDDQDKWNQEYRKLLRKYRNDACARSKRFHIEKLYSSAFCSPVTHEKAKVDPAKPRFTLFGGTLKIGDTITMPTSDSTPGRHGRRGGSSAYDPKPLGFNVEYIGVDKKDGFGTSVHFIPYSGVNDGGESLIDGSQVWSMKYKIKNFMGLEDAETLWYREAGSNKLVMFWCEVKNRNAGNSEQAHETRARLEKAIKGKYPDMEKTYHDNITEEYMMNGDILEIMQSPVVKEGGFFDAPFVKVSMITPSIVSKILALIDEGIKQEYENFKKKDQGALDNF